MVKAKHKPATAWRAHLVLAGLIALTLAPDRAVAERGSPAEAVAARDAGEPILAIVSLQHQRITVYDSSGWILRAPVSSGQKGRETPAGIFSIIQKEADHYSNLYDDAYMPNMQRITWSGIALHGGSLPGYPASHGCVRLPFEFAEQLFDETRLGLRVIVAPSDAAPVEIPAPALFPPKPDAGALAAARTVEAQEATKKADQARAAAGTAFREAARATGPVREAENLKLRAAAQLTAAETALGAAVTAEAQQQAEDAKTQATARIAELQAQWDAAKAELQPKLDAVKATREAAVAAETARAAAAEAARQATRELEPVSILISRKTQRLYVRQGFEPILDSPVTIADPDRPIGTHVFTALEKTNGEKTGGEKTDSDGMRWNVVSLDGGHPPAATESRGWAHGRDAEPVPTDPAAAKAALERIVIPADVLDRIPALAPRSSLIVTDEALSSETGKGTDFVVLLSGEPQGGIKFRHHTPETEVRYAPLRERQPYWRAPVGGMFSTW